MTAAGAESKRGERRNRSSSSKNTLYYNDPPDPQHAHGGGGSYSGGVWISSLLDSCASGMQLLGNTCADVSASQNSNTTTCSSSNSHISKITCQEDDTENVENNQKKMNNIIYKQTQSNNRRRLFNNNNNNNNSSNNMASAAVMGQDFAVLHDDFLESLLAEADGENNISNASASHSVGMDESMSSASSTGLFSRLDSSTVGEAAVATTASAEEEQQEEEAARIAASAARKRRRPLRLRKHKTLPPPTLLQNNISNSNHHQQLYQSFAAQEGSTTNNSSQHHHHQEQYIMNDDESAAALHKRKMNADFSSNSTLDSASNHNNNTDPSVFLHEHVRMQKDKGKGEAVGSNICAKGKLACLQKLRAKMRLLTEVALKDATMTTTSGGGGGGHCGSSNASTASSVITVATMKRKQARIALQTETFCETRSLIELKMGFLSMSYGVLLRWDITRTRTITLVVLRKSVYESFYPTRLSLNEPAAQAQQQQQQHPYKRHKEFTNNNINSHNASNNSSPSSSSSSRQQGLKNNSLLDPPYYVSRPLDLQLQPTILQVSVLYATGLNKRCNWTIQLLLQGRVESILLAYDPDRERLYPKLGEALRHELSNASFSPSSPLVPPPLEIKLWEHTATARGGGVRRSIHNIKDNNSRKLVCAMRVSWDDLPISTSSSSSTSTTTTDSTLVTVPCLHDVEHATIGLDVLFQSDYLYWMQQELQARRGHHGQSPTPVPASNRSSSLPLPLSLCTSREFVDIGCSPFSSNQGRIISPLQRQVEEEEQEDANSPWEWICSVC